MDPLVWVVVGVVLAAVEAATFTLVIGPIGVAALLAAAASALGASLAVQLIVLVGVSLAAVLALRPVARAHQERPTHRTGVAALTGTTGRTVSEVTDESGQIRLGGELWTARSEFEDERIAEGARVTVVRIEGATAIVQELD